MVFQECAPCLRRWLSAPRHVFRNRCFGDFDSELQKFAVNLRCAPERIRVARRLGRYEVIEALADVMLVKGVPEHIRSDNGPEFVAKDLREWLAKVGTGT